MQKDELAYRVVIVRTMQVLPPHVTYETDECHIGKTQTYIFGPYATQKQARGMRTRKATEYNGPYFKVTDAFVEIAGDWKRLDG
jgi:hypothetical protein